MPAFLLILTRAGPSSPPSTCPNVAAAEICLRLRAVHFYHTLLLPSFLVYIFFLYFCPFSRRAARGLFS